MYVIMILGLISSCSAHGEEILPKTNRTLPKDIGRQESVTFYHLNGSNLNLKDLPTPLLTNVTAENVVGVAPVNTTVPWEALKNLGIKLPPQSDHSAIRSRRNVVKIPANITKASFLIPSEIGLQSISLPLMSLNSNLSRIPVPIPNVSVVSYTKANTVVHKP
ncbi:uncharacterized protein LOC119835839 [Zerene cesonia]|uniref:uncharacterized protein LOC119835839 n=1 Tax=Zerene cesonia TaxID=33412 RepID=UPI0018E540EC|nr:uncharacterized protein LOC119835839 [Zerene cesonia]